NAASSRTPPTNYVRIALRPVETIRVLTASVTASDPRERVTVPATGHEISTAPAHAHGNLDEYERLLRDLVDNAARHAAHRIRITIRNQDAWVVTTVHDDGPGVPTEDAERIFERFVRLDDARSRDRGGTGLGLAIARDLAHRHRGTLTLTPRPLGACFELRLPRAPTTAEE
ncbi:sensor histidine kinase, partial [Streptomyces sp. NPDC127044]